MWISRTTFERLLLDAADANGQLHAIKLQCQAQQSTLDWMAMRLTQSEHERAQLIHNYTGVKITVPSIEQTSNVLSSADVLNSGVSFDDVGDEEALKQGISWDPGGEVVYSKRA